MATKHFTQVSPNWAVKRDLPPTRRTKNCLSSAYFSSRLRCTYFSIYGGNVELTNLSGGLPQAASAEFKRIRPVAVI